MKHCNTDSSTSTPASVADLQSESCSQLAPMSSHVWYNADLELLLAIYLAMADSRTRWATPASAKSALGSTFENKCTRCFREHKQGHASADCTPCWLQFCCKSSATSLQQIEPCHHRVLMSAIVLELGVEVYTAVGHMHTHPQTPKVMQLWRHD